MASNPHPEPTYEVFTVRQGGRKASRRFRLGCAWPGENGEIQVALVGSPINGKMTLVPIDRSPRKR
jgi:hypothetical protein